VYRSTLNCGKRKGRACGTRPFKRRDLRAGVRGASPRGKRQSHLKNPENLEAFLPPNDFSLTDSAQALSTDNNYPPETTAPDSPTARVLSFKDPDCSSATWIVNCTNLLI
jgi:hypothetical protein